ncbi:MAG: Cohesin domain-containing protein [Oscillospiraceae bacterium]|jgi:hypothetical protein
MNYRRLFKIACLFFLLTNVLTVSAAASSQTYFSYSLDPISAAQAEMIRLNVTAYKTETTAAAFRLKIYYDEDKLEYVSTETSGAVKSGTMRTNCSSGFLSCVYVCNPEKGYAPKLSGTVASFLFQVEPDARSGKTSLTITADQICDYDGNPLEAANTEKELTLKILPQLSSQASLTELTPSTGTLVPEFSPSVFNYALTVGSEINTVEFKARAADGGTVHVSRSKLNGAGKETLITVTVTSEDQTQTAQYTITVNREEKEANLFSAQVRNANNSTPSSIEKIEEPIEQPKGTSSNTSSRPLVHSDAVQITQPSTAGQSTLTPNSTVGQAGQNQPEKSVKKTLVLVGDRMPSFFTGMLAAALCITVGIAVSLWFPIQRRKP